MKHKIRKITTTMLATICAFSSVAAISASAASSTRYAEMSNGYTVSSTASYSGNTTSGKGSVTNGGPCSIKYKMLEACCSQVVVLPHHFAPSTRIAPLFLRRFTIVTSITLDL